MSLITVGTMAFDAIETPHRKVDKIVGGSALYVAYAASYFTKPVMQISIVGNDFPKDEMESLEKRGIKLEGVEIVPDEKSFFWSGKYHDDMNNRDTLITDLNVLANFNPIVPESYQGAKYLMLGNLMPKLQLSVIEQLKEKPKLIVMDTMNFWMEIALDDLKAVFTKVDVLMVNDSEAKQLSEETNIVKAAKKILTMGPKYLIIKKGEHGALLFFEDEIFVAPAMPLEKVFDPTGAGDTFAGGFMGYLAKCDKVNFETMKNAIIVGTAMASFCVEQFGPDRMRNLSEAEINERLLTLKKLAHYDIQDLFA